MKKEEVIRILENEIDRGYKIGAQLVSPGAAKMYGPAYEDACRNLIRELGLLTSGDLPSRTHR